MICTTIGIFAVFTVSVLSSGGMALSDEKRLIKHLLENYEKVGVIGRPVYNASEVVRVKFGVALVQVLNINSMDQTGTFLMWYRHSWQDMLLRWNPEDFGGVKHVRLPRTKIWTPDVVLHNSVGPEQPVTDAMAVVTSNGAVLWIPPMRVTVKCVSDGGFPFDTQHCGLKYGSWTYDGFKLDIDMFENEEQIDITDYIPDNDWNLLTTTGKKSVLYYPCCEEPFPNVRYSLEFIRASAFPQYTFVLPTVLLFLLILVIFWLHPGSVSRFVIGGLVFVVLLSLMAHLALFYRATKFVACLSLGLILTFTTMLTSVITSAVAKRGETGQALPKCFNVVCVRVCGVILCSDRPLQTKADSDSKGDGETDKAMLRQQWVAFAQVLDRMAFMVHFIVLLVFAGIFGQAERA